MTETTTQQATSSELLAVESSRRLRNSKRVFAGIGLPTLAVALARQTVNPQLEQVFESGVCGAHPKRLPETIADAPLATGAEAILPMHALFAYVLQGGYIDVGFLGAAQIDRWGNLNSTVIGDYDNPRVRLPGSGGAAEVMANSREVFVVLRRHDTQTFVDRLDFNTSPSPRGRSAQGRARGVTTVITPLGVLEADATGELVLTQVHAGVDPEAVVAGTGWPLKVVDAPTTTEPPTPRELDLLRNSIDPGRVYLR